MTSDFLEENLEKETKDNSKEIFKKIEEMLPKEAGFVKAEFEGPDIVVILKNIKAVYSDGYIVKNIAVAIKKKLIVRSESSSLMPPDKALEKIKELIPPDAIIKEPLRFISEFGEVYIEALKPGLVIGKNGDTLKRIAMETGWLPKVLRTPTMSSSVLGGVRQLLFNEMDFRKKFLHDVGKRINKKVINTEWLKATALGGYREVGRSSLLLETPNSKVIIDCGISPEPAIKGVAEGTANNAYPYLDSAIRSIEDIDAVILTHAHMDHVGFVPYLFKYGYNGPVYCTPPSRDISALVLNDYIKLMQRSGITPLYEEKDVRKMLTHMITRDYDEVTNITDEMKLTYHNAGHILGSATLHLHIGEGLYNIVHTGDMNYGYTRLFDRTWTKYPRIDSLFIESTYGGPNDISPNRQQTELDLMNIIKKTVLRGGKVLIPVFAVGRAQEVQVVLENYMGSNNSNKEYKMDVPVFLDGMVLESSAIHTAYPEYLKDSLKNSILSNRSPFESEIFEVIKGEREDVFDKGSSIVIASGGMLNGGASLEYFKKFADDPKNSIVFVGYNSQGSLGRRVENGVKEIVLPDSEGKLSALKVALEVNSLHGLSGHSDRRQLINFVENLRPRPKNIYTMHGEEHKCDNLARTLGKIMHCKASAPMNLDSIRMK